MCHEIVRAVLGMYQWVQSGPGCMQTKKVSLFTLLSATPPQVAISQRTASGSLYLLVEVISAWILELDFLLPSTFFKEKIGNTCSDATLPLDRYFLQSLE